MRIHERIGMGRVCFLLAAMLVGGMGANCGVPSILDPIISYDTVEIELVNETDYDVDPWLYVSPSASIFYEDDLINDDNYVDVYPPLAPGETAIYTFDCDDAGTITTDHAELLLSDFEYILSDNAPWVVWGDDFDCGDVISFIFIDDGVDFYTRVEVNGYFLTDQ